MKIQETAQKDVYSLNWTLSEGADHKFAASVNLTLDQLKEIHKWIGDNNLCDGNDCACHNVGFELAQDTVGEWHRP